MDIERALLKAGVTVAAMFAIYQGSQGMQQFAKQRSAEVKDRHRPERQEPSTDYLESLRLVEAERRRSDVIATGSSIYPDLRQAADRSRGGEKQSE